MTLLLPLLILIPVVFCLPAWFIARKRYNATTWSLTYAVPSMVLWVILAMSGIGSQSLSNVVELLYLCFGSVPIYYLKVLYIDKIRPDTRRNTILATVMLCVVAIILRLVMPDLPE